MDAPICQQVLILLIDEIEQHLHYDAQADLIQLLQRDPHIKKVIYTTHSAGSLPEDLGSGVHLIQWDSEQKKRSKIINRFWHGEDQNGFKPLLFGMGAATMAFFPTRKALIGEGPTELLLLPKLLKEALELDDLGFQIIHGLANINPTGLPMLDSVSDGVSYVVDSDAAGDKLKKALIDAGVKRSRIFSIGEGTEAITLEDLLDEHAWVLAVNKYIEQYGEKVGLSELIAHPPKQGRIRALPEAIRKQKINFAYNVLDLIARDPNYKILSPDKRLALKRIGTKMLVSLGLQKS